MVTVLGRRDSPSVWRNNHKEGDNDGAGSNGATRITPQTIASNDRALVMTLLRMPATSE